MVQQSIPRTQLVQWIVDYVPSFTISMLLFRPFQNLSIHDNYRRQIMVGDKMSTSHGLSIMFPVSLFLCYYSISKLVDR
jgi:hypothetical protein